MRPEQNPLDFPLSLGRLGDLSVYLVPDEETSEPRPIILDSPRSGFLQSLVPLAEAAISADLRRVAQEAEAELEQMEPDVADKGEDSGA